MNEKVKLVSDSPLNKEYDTERLHASYAISTKPIQLPLFQLDGNITTSTLSDSSGSLDESQDVSDSSYCTDDEADPVVTPVNLTLIQPLPNQPIKLEVKKKLPAFL